MRINLNNFLSEGCCATLTFDYKNQQEEGAQQKQDIKDKNMRERKELRENRKMEGEDVIGERKKEESKGRNNGSKDVREIDERKVEKGKAGK